MHRSTQGRKMTWRRHVAVGGLIVALAACASTPAGAPRVMQPEDFKMLAGNWYGSEYIQQAAPQAIQGVIQETGAFFTVLRGAPGAQRPGMMKIVDGGVVYETATSKGKMTFHESEDKANWVWKWQGTTTDGGAVRSELTKPK
ncbi:MAG: hypothetical protein ACREJR_08335 [Candidatus Rokuibacteriota bacterium]